MQVLGTLCFAPLAWAPEFRGRVLKVRNWPIRTGCLVLVQKVSVSTVSVSTPHFNRPFFSGGKKRFCPQILEPSLWHATLFWIHKTPLHTAPCWLFPVIQLRVDTYFCGFGVPRSARTWQRGVTQRNRCHHMYHSMAYGITHRDPVQHNSVNNESEFPARSTTSLMVVSVPTK